MAGLSGAGKQLLVKIVGDASSLNKALKSSTDATGKWNQRVQRAGRVAGFAGLAIGGALVVGLTKATKGAIEDESAMARLTNAFKQSDVPIKGFQKSIEEAQKAGVQLGFADDEIVESLGSLVVATHDGKRAIDLLSVAEDIARFKHIDLATASKTLTMAMAGSQRATKQLGLTITPTTENVDALKEAAKRNKTEVDSMALAHAKTADKMATSGQVIDLVTHKLKGQSEAFSETAAGGIARTTASLDRLSDTIGAALLPALVKITPPLSKFFSFLADNPKLAQGLVIGIAALAAALIALSIAASAAASIGVLASVFAVILSPIGLVVVAVIALTAAIAAAVLWPDKLQAALQRMGLSAKDAKTTVDSLRAAFVAIKAVVDAVWPAMQAVIVPALKVIAGLLMIVSGVLRGDFSQAWKGIKQVVENELRFILALVTAFPRVVLTAAVRIGRALLDGIAQGAAQLRQVVMAKLAEIPGAILAMVGVAGAAAAQIGRVIVSGILSGMAGLFSSVKDKIIGGVQGAIDGAMGIFGHSPQEIIGVALIDGIVRGWNSASDKLKPAVVDKVNEVIDAAQAAVIAKQGVFAQAFDELVSQALAAFDRVSSEFQTKTEKLISKQDEARANRDRKRALSEAQTGLAEAQAGGDPEAIKQAAQAVQDALFAIQRAADEKKAAQERAQFEASRERRRVNFESQLAELQTSFANQELTVAQFNQRLIKLFKKFEIPFNKSALALGAQLAAGLNAAMGDVRKAARNLAQEIVDRLSEITVRVHVELQDPGKPEKRQHGGPVKRGSAYVVGEAGPELFIPNMSGRISPSGSASMSAFGGGGGVNVFVYGDVTGEEIVRKVREGLLRIDLYNPGSAIARS